MTFWNIIKNWRRPPPRQQTGRPYPPRLPDVPPGTGLYTKLANAMVENFNQKSSIVSAVAGARTDMLNLWSNERPDIADRLRHTTAGLLASYLCTTIARFIYLLVVNSKYPHKIIGIRNFRDYYVHAFNITNTYIPIELCNTPPITTDDFVDPFVSTYMPEQGLIRDYFVPEYKPTSKYLMRSVRGIKGQLVQRYTDDQLLAQMFAWSPQPLVVYIRMGWKYGNGTGSHSICAVRCLDGLYRLLDSYYEHHNGMLITQVFGKGRPGWLHFIDSYTPDLT